MFDWIKIISGAQSGADYGGLLFGLNYDVETEINIFKEFRPYSEYPNLSYYRDYLKLSGRSGNILDWIRVNYICNESNYVNNLRCRTKYNVQNSDITLVFIQKQLSDTRGSKLTVKLCKELNKSYIVIWLKANKLDISLDNMEKGFEYYNGLRGLDIYEILIELNEIYNDYIKRRRKLVINIAGERTIDEIRVVKLLEQIFDDEINPKELI